MYFQLLFQHTWGSKIDIQNLFGKRNCDNHIFYLIINKKQQLRVQNNKLFAIHFHDSYFRLLGPDSLVTTDCCLETILILESFLHLAWVWIMQKQVVNLLFFPSFV